MLGPDSCAVRTQQDEYEIFLRISILGLKLQDKIPCSKIRKRTKRIDIIEFTLKQKWRSVGHIAKMKGQYPSSFIGLMVQPEIKLK